MSDATLPFVYQTLTMITEKDQGVSALVPVVDGSSLIDLVGAYESAQAFAPAGAYGGLIAAHFRFGDLTDYYRGIEKRQSPREGHLWLLGCDCGEVGCWPLEAEVMLTDEYVTWSSFAQPHRPAWSYAGFGPFVFDRGQYEAAIVACADTIAP